MSDTANKQEWDEAKTYTGKVWFFNNEKGYGFIRTEEGGDKLNGTEVFVHFSVCPQRDGTAWRWLNENEEIEFEVENGPKGPIAKKVLSVDGKEVVYKNGRATLNEPVKTPGSILGVGESNSWSDKVQAKDKQEQQEIQR